MNDSFDKMSTPIKNKYRLHPKLESLFRDIYHYASDNGGIGMSLLAAVMKLILLMPK